jgi:hypothetical protein
MTRIFISVSFHREKVLRRWSMREYRMRIGGGAAQANARGLTL